jgi:hypothetical protein
MDGALIMAKIHLKRWIWLIVSAATAGLIVGVLALVSGIIVYFSSGADPSTALNLVPQLPADLDERLVWLPDHANAAEGRSLDPFTRQQIADAYLRAWAQLAISYELGRPYGLQSYFSGPALDLVTTTLTDTVAAGWTVRRSNIGHELELFFLSDGGTVVALTDQNNRLVQQLRHAQSGVDEVVESSDRLQLLMLLEDGNWRIRFWRRIGAGDSLPTALAAAPIPGLVGVTGRGLTLDGAPFVVAGVSYYPREASWDEFWPTYDPLRTAADLSIMRSLGLNTVRIFVPFFDVSDDDALAKMVADLADFLEQADSAGMKVIVTLFDHRTDHHPVNWGADGRYLAALIPPFAHHPALLAWDLKNEADLDYPLHGAALVDQWLVYVAREIRRYDAGHLLTVGWSSPEAAANPTVAAVTDLISYHYLDPAADYPQRAGTLRVKLPDHPLLLGEFGLPTWDGFFPGGHTEAEQAVHYASILRSHRQLESVGYLSWTLYDYTRVNLAQFRTPWRRAAQANMGVVRVDGSLKPAAALLRPQADLDLPALPIWHRFTKRFWRAVALVALSMSLILVWRYRRRLFMARR